MRHRVPIPTRTPESGGPAATDTPRPLPGALRERFQRSLGVDLGAVRVHRGPGAGAAADALSARALTVGQDIYVAEQETGPGTAEGDSLLAHEVVHAAQQADAPRAQGDRLALSQPGDPAEREADRLAASVLAGSPAAVQAQPGGEQVMRTFRSTGISANSLTPGELAVSDLLIDANAWISSDTFYPVFGDLNRSVPVALPRLPPSRPARATIQLNIFAEVPGRLYGTNQEKVDSFMCDWYLNVDQNGKVTGATSSRVYPTPRTINGARLEIQDKVEGTYSLSLTPIFTNAPITRRQTDATPNYRFNVGADGKIGLGRLGSAIGGVARRISPRLGRIGELVGGALPSGDVTARGSVDVNVPVR